jgi:hypothetical protein
MIEAKLDFWLKNNLNVLLKGKHGIGKTSLIKDCFNRAGVKSVYFSTPTMDPWVDFVGIPKEVVPERGESFLDFIRPRAISDNLEAIFFDEFNRPNSPKILDAVMELIQFKTINGRKLPKLRVIWAAVNPDGEDFAVETLDPAQKDRFQIHYELPYIPSFDFFSKKFGEKNATTAITWWNELSEEQKHLISPRRLEYTLDVYSLGGDIRDVLPSSANASKLLLELKTEPLSATLGEIILKKDIEAAKQFLKSENNFSSSIDLICKDKETLSFIFPLLSEERQMMFLSEKKEVQSLVLEYPEKYLEIGNRIWKMNPKSPFSKKLKKKISPLLSNRYFNDAADPKELRTVIDSEWIKSQSENASERRKKWKFLKPLIPSLFNCEEDLIELLMILVSDILDWVQDRFVYEDMDLVYAINHCIKSYEEKFLDPSFCTLEQFKHNFVGPYSLKKLAKFL